MTPITQRRDDGFTLVELIIVIVILGVLAGIAIPAYLATRSKAADATAVSDLRNAATVEEVQLADSGSYSSSIAALDANGLRRSPGLKLGVAASSVGYCAVAQDGGTYWWFDSSAGGVQHATTKTLAPPTSATGVCSSSVPTQLS